MGDISTEPSMEEILSSIKRIIAEEGDAAVTTRSRRVPKAAPRPEPEAADGDEVLELREPAPEEPAPAAPRLEPVPAVAAVADTPPQGEAILSPGAIEASRGKLEALSRLVVKPETAGSDTLEGLVRALLKPMLREWLDANLPQIVDEMVAREIARITTRP